MENPELNKIEKQISKLTFDEDPLKLLINQVDEIYIVLDEKMRINTYNEELSTIKSNLAKTIDKHENTEERQKAFATSKKDLLLLMNQISSHI